MKRMIAAVTAAALTFFLSACDNTTPGVVNSVDGVEITHSVGNCNLKDSWSITVDPDGHEGESIDARAKYRFRVCMSQEEAQSYKSGDRYPKGK